MPCPRTCIARAPVPSLVDDRCDACLLRVETDICKLRLKVSTPNKSRVDLRSERKIYVQDVFKGWAAELRSKHVVQSHCLCVISSSQLASPDLNQPSIL